MISLGRAYLFALEGVCDDLSMGCIRGDRHLLMHVDQRLALFGRLGYVASHNPMAPSDSNHVRL